MVTVVVIEFSVMRCQPLRRALGLFVQEQLRLKMRIRSIGEKGIHCKHDWLRESQIQLRSSQMLRDKASECLLKAEKLNELSQSQNSYRNEIISLFEDSHAANKTSYLLLGYAFELLLKAGVLSIYVGLSKDLFESEIKSKFGHDLVKMTGVLGIEIDEKENSLLATLKNDITNAARYPVKVNSVDDYCSVTIDSTSRYSCDDIYNNYMFLYSRIKEFVLRIDNTSDDPKLSYEVCLDEDGYFIYRSGGSLPTMMVYKFSQLQIKNGEDNRDSLLQLLKSGLKHPAFKHYIERDWVNSQHLEHKGQKLVSS
ncbi:hypothetical protein K6P21_003616 [Vibrio cholerae]|nr:hypothetical protein [Vibrio cholerae]EJL6364768.1 hypothetical protein [Vibrio cholerae]